MLKVVMEIVVGSFHCIQMLSPNSTTRRSALSHDKCVPSAGRRSAVVEAIAVIHLLVGAAGRYRLVEFFVGPHRTAWPVVVTFYGVGWDCDWSDIARGLLLAKGTHLFCIQARRWMLEVVMEILVSSFHSIQMLSPNSTRLRIRRFIN